MGFRGPKVLNEQKYIFNLRKMKRQRFDCKQNNSSIEISYLIDKTIWILHSLIDPASTDKIVKNSIY